MGTDPSGASPGARDKRWIGALALLMVGSTILLVAVRANIGFFLDDWMLVMFRDEPTDWLLPHHEHTILIPAAIFDLSLTTFGMKPMPLHLVAATLFLTSVFLLFRWLRTLVGDAAAVLGCAVVLFLGSSAEDLIWTFQIGFCGSMATGLGALLLLRHRSFPRDLASCFLLVASILLSTLAVPFIAAALIQIAFGEENRPGVRRLLRSSWILLFPLVLYGIWWFGWNQSGEHAATVSNAIESPIYALSAFGYAAATLTGTFPIRRINESYLWSLVGLMLAAGFAWLLHSRRRVPPQFLVGLAAGLTFWILCGLNLTPGREFFTGRYLYPGVVFLLMMIGGACHGLRPNRVQLRWIGTVAAVSIAVNVIALFYSVEHTIRPFEEKGMVTVAAFELSGDRVSPDFAAQVGTGDDALLDAENYLNAVARYGPPGFSDAELRKASAGERARLDQLQVSSLPVSLFAGRAIEPRRTSCVTAMADSLASDSVRVPADTLHIRARNQAIVRLGRFGPGTPAVAWAVPAGVSVGYRIPPDGSGRAWRIAFQGSGPVRVCPAQARRPSS